MTLAEFLSTSSIPDGIFAQRIGVSRQALHRYKTGERIPRRDQMHRIAEATGGAVTANDFLGLSPSLTPAPEASDAA